MWVFVWFTSTIFMSQRPIDNGSILIRLRFVKSTECGRAYVVLAHQNDSMSSKTKVWELFLCLPSHYWRKCKKHGHLIFFCNSLEKVQILKGIEMFFIFSHAHRVDTIQCGINRLSNIFELLCRVWCNTLIGLAKNKSSVNCHCK